MKNKWDRKETLEARIFICLALIVVLLGFCGCHSVKYEWFPDNDSPDPKKKNPHVINVLKVSH
tara:strand:- start:3619 stop:3807 length:189 start_codon:yes stop_codon:yes gene_type:complete